MSYTEVEEPFVLRTSGDLLPIDEATQYTDEITPTDLLNIDSLKQLLANGLEPTSSFVNSIHEHINLDIRTIVKLSKQKTNPLDMEYFYPREEISLIDYISFMGMVNCAALMVQRGCTLDLQTCIASGTHSMVELAMEQITQNSKVNNQNSGPTTEDVEFVYQLGYVEFMDIIDPDNKIDIKLKDLLYLEVPVRSLNHYFKTHPGQVADGVFLTNAFYTRNASILKLMLARGGVLNPDFPSVTPLMAAVAEKDYPMAGILISLGADPNLEDPYGKTAQDYAGPYEYEYLELLNEKQ